MNLERYNEKAISYFHRVKCRSYYCHNYYFGWDGDVICGISDDDNRTDYYMENLDMLWFAESFADEGDIVHVFEEYLV